MKRNNLLYIASLIFFIIVSGILIMITLDNIKLNDEIKSNLNESNQQVQRTKRELFRYRTLVSVKAISQASKSDNELVKDFGSNYDEYFMTKDLVSKFLKNYLTWNNSKEYQNRANSLSKYITPELAQNKTIFDSGKDTTGSNYIQNLKLKSQYVNANIEPTTEKNGNDLIVLASAKQKSWYSDNYDKAGTTKGYYKVTVDTESKKITNFEVLTSSVKGL